MVGGAKVGSRVERTRGKAAADEPSEVVDCGAGWAKLQLAGEAVVDGLGDRPSNPEFQLGKIKLETTD